MTFIDWSDPEEMMGLLLDYVADERAGCSDDRHRRRFLSGLLAELGAIEDRLGDASPSELVRGLRAVQESMEPGFEGDPAVVHLEDCIDELERLVRETALFELNDSDADR